MASWSLEQWAKAERRDGGSVACGSPNTRPKTHAKVNLAAKRHTQRPGEAKTHHTTPPAGAHRVSRGQARALGHQTPRSAAKRRRHGRQTRPRGVHRAPRDSDSNRANRAREKVRAVPMPSASGMSGRAASVAAWLRAVCEHAAAAAPHFGAENGERRRRLAGCGARGGRPTHLGLGVRAQADGSERRARGWAAPEHARARHARPRRPPERPSGAYSGGFAN